MTAGVISAAFWDPVHPLVVVVVDVVAGSALVRLVSGDVVKGEEAEAYSMAFPGCDTCHFV